MRKHGPLLALASIAGAIVVEQKVGGWLGAGAVVVALVVTIAALLAEPTSTDRRPW